MQGAGVARGEVLGAEVAGVGPGGDGGGVEGLGSGSGSGNIGGSKSVRPEIKMGNSLIASIRPEIKMGNSLIASVDSVERKLLRACRKVITSQICLSIRLVGFKSGVKSVPASSGAEIQFRQLTFAEVECAVARGGGAGAARGEGAGAAREECAVLCLGVARGECAVLGVARADDLSAEKQGSRISARREAKNGVRNALAGSRAEIQTKLKFGL